MNCFATARPSEDHFNFFGPEGRLTENLVHRPITFLQLWGSLARLLGGTDRGRLHAHMYYVVNKALFTT